MTSAGTSRRVKLREEHRGPDSRFLDAYMDAEGNLHIDGQDLGPSTGPVSSDGEYEWFETIKAADLPHLRVLLEIPEDADILDALETSWTGPRAAVLEARLRKAPFPVNLFVWSG